MRLPRRLGTGSDNVGAAIPVCVDAPSAKSTDVEHELVRLGQAFVEVELDALRRDAAKRPLGWLTRCLEIDRRAAAAARLRGPHIQASAAVTHKSNCLWRSIDAHWG